MNKIDYWGNTRFVSANIRRIRSHITAAINIVDCEAATPMIIIKHIHRNGARDITIHIVTAKSVSYGSAIKVKLNITINIGRRISLSLRAAIHFTNHTAQHIEGDVTVDVGLIGAAIEFAEVTGTAIDGSNQVTIDYSHIATAKRLAVEHITMIIFIMGKVQTGFCNIAKFITSAEHLVDNSGIERSCSRTINVGAWVTYSSAITAAKDMLDTATFDNHVCVGSHSTCSGTTHIGCITTAENIFDGVVTVIYMHRGVVRRIGSGNCIRDIRRLIAAAVNSSKCKGLW